jgi:hypothetical protein
VWKKPVIVEGKDWKIEPPKKGTVEHVFGKEK